MHQRNDYATIAAAWRTEMSRAELLLSNKDVDSAFRHFERAHILGQRFTMLHVRAHWGMLRVGWRRKDVRELVGQFTRIIAATVFSRIWVPVGNTGGANVSAFRPMPIPHDLAQFLAETPPSESDR